MKSPQDIINHYSRRDERMSDTAKAKTYWVWTELAERKNPARARAGEPIWHHQMYSAPKFMLKDGLIIDSSDVELTEKQANIFDYLV